MRAVLDTNTALALWWFEDPTLAPLAAAIDAGAVEPIVSPPLEGEWRTVLVRLQRVVATPRGAAAHQRFLTATTRLPHPDAATCASAALPLCRDPEDQKFLECAWFHRATWLITRDRALLALARHRALRPVLAIVRPEAWVAAYRPPYAPAR